MLNVQIRVKYENDWTADLERYDVKGQFLASTFRDRRYLGIVTLDVAKDDYEDVLETIEKHDTTESVAVIESSKVERDNRITLTTRIRGTYLEYTPLQILLYEGYLPFGAFGELRDGRILFDLLVEDRESISESVALLQEFGSVHVERITNNFQSDVIPSVTEWQNLLGSFSERQRAVINTALEMGYYELPRETTLEEIADEVGVAKTTVSQHLRKAEDELIKFVVPYVNLTAD